MSFCVQYGDSETSVRSTSEDGLQLCLAVPCLGQTGREHWPLGGAGASSLLWTREAGGWYAGRSGDLMWLCALGDAQDDTLEPLTGSLYSSLFAILGQEWRLQRVWHYLPRINDAGADGLERYRAFCRGRSLAFETAFGNDFQKHLPAASAVGCEGSKFVIYACARRSADVRYFENPLQVPAYRYSQQYGPRAPGFARASLTVVPSAAGAPESGSAVVSQHEIYLSGTASIREERSEVAGGVLGQLAITVENLNLIAAQCGLERFFAKEVCGATALPASVGGLQAAPHSDGNWLRRCFKVYLRHAEDYPLVSGQFNTLLCKGDEVVYVRSDICRAELDLEIEASVLVAEG